MLSNARTRCHCCMLAKRRVQQVGEMAAVMVASPPKFSSSVVPFPVSEPVAFCHPTGETAVACRVKPITLKIRRSVEVTYHW